MVVDGVRFFFLGGGRDHWIEDVSMSEFWRTGCTPYLVFHDGVLLYLRLALADRLDEVEVLARLEARHLRRRHGADPTLLRSSSARAPTRRVFLLLFLLKLGKLEASQLWWTLFARDVIFHRFQSIRRVADVQFAG